jgi:hypothetical protein
MSEMIARKIRFLSLLTLVLVALVSVRGTQAAAITNDLSLGCRNWPGGGGGGGGQLTQAEIDGLLFMREEEKLARDSYLTLYNKWHLPIFSKIASSEVMHMTRVKDLLDRYVLPDPAAGKAIGEFTNPILQQLYNDLMTQGNRSSTEALKVGATIEEVDIKDLKNYSAATNKTDILQVYTNLMSASYNHLSAFNSQLGK